MYVGVADLIARWVYTRQGVHNLIKTAAFPAPVFTINQGRNKVWLLADIEAYEQAHPELRDDEAKRQKVLGYYRALGKPRTPPDQPK